MRPKNMAKEADIARQQFTHPDGDHLTLLNVFHAFKSSEFLTFKNTIICTCLNAVNRSRRKLVLEQLPLTQSSASSRQR